MEPETVPDNSEPVEVGDYVLESKLGEGSFSTVWKAEHRLSGQLVALKQVYLSRLNRHLRSCLDCELNFLSSVNHPNIIRLFEVFQVRRIIALSFHFSALVAYPFR
jgi:serine/threonine protein kinase